MHYLLATSFIMAAVTAAQAETTIQCNSPQETASITAAQFTQNGRVFDCIEGDFVSDLTPCAPDGAFALSAPTGDAAIVDVVDRWQDYASHDGGVTAHFTTPTAVYFSGGWNSLDDGYHELWSFDVNRITGVATLNREGSAAVRFTCAKVNALF